MLHGLEMGEPTSPPWLPLIPEHNWKPVTVAQRDDRQGPELCSPSSFSAPWVIHLFQSIAEYLLVLGLMPSPREPVTGTGLSHRAYCHRRETALNTLFFLGGGGGAHGMQGVSSPTRDQIHAPCSGNRVLNHWTPREVPGLNNLIKVE